MFSSSCSTAEEVDQVLIIAVKFMLNFVTFFSTKTVRFIRNLYVLTDLTSATTSTALHVYIYTERASFLGFKFGNVVG